MSTQKKEKNKFRARLKQSYRFIIRNDDDFREINSFKLSLSAIYWLIFGIVFIIGFLLLSFIIFTPVKRLIPGYGDINNNAVYAHLNNEITELETQLDEQITYTEALKKMVFSAEKKLNKDNATNTVSMLSNEESKQLAYLLSPVNGKISMSYLLKKNHFGVDLVCAKNTEVKAITSGVVINTVWDPNTGNTICVQHMDNLVSIYKHNAILLKKTGDYVSAGEAIAIVGNSGEQSTGPHLHFELWYNGKPTDPEVFIDF